MPTPQLPPGATLEKRSQPQEIELRLPPGATLPDKFKDKVRRYKADAKGTTVYMSPDQMSELSQPDQPDIKQLWSGLTQDQRDQVISQLPAEDQAKLMDQLGLTNHAEGVHASPQLSYNTMYAILTGNPEADPWIRGKTLNLINQGARYLPAAAGTFGGIAGGAAGTALFGTEGGTYGGAVLGSGVGGATGEAGRQAINKYMGWEDTPLTADERTEKIAKEGIDQMVAETLGFGAGRLLKPTLEQAINKLYFAGHFSFGDPMEKGAVESVYQDLARVEKTSGARKATTVGDLISVLDETKRQIGAQVDQSMAQPIVQNGRRVMLGHAVADTTGIQTQIRSLLTAHPSIVEEAAINPAGKSAKYLQQIRDEADKYARGNWNYFKLCNKRILLNNELAPLYELPPGEQRAYLNDHPDLQIKKKEADAIRDITYQQMDLVSGHPKGTTAVLQGKRGVIMQLSSEANRHLEALKTGARIEAGSPLSQKINVSTYGTSSGKPGIAVHRLHRLVTLGRVTPESIADKRVAGAFGHTVGQKVRQGLGSRVGRELMSLPIRALTAPDAIPEEKLETVPLPASPSPQASAAPAPAKRYAHTATGPGGHRIGSDDGVSWFDLSTGQKVA